MSNAQQFDRRSFCKFAAAGTVAFLVEGKLAYADKLAAHPLVSDLPKLDGVFVFDSAVCRAMADDFGHYVHRMPLGVLFPRSVQDVQKIVRYARTKNLKVAMRGHGCSAY